MGPLAALIELHTSSGGWSTAALLVVAVSVVLVGRLVMLGDNSGSWMHEHPLALGIGAAVATIVVVAGLAALFDELFGLTWPALPIGMSLLAIGLLCLGRR